MNPIPRLRIAAYIHSLAGGGAERVMATLVSQLVDRGHEVTLVTLDDGLHDRHDVDERVRRLRLGVMRNSHNAIDRIINPTRRLAAIRASVKQITPQVVLSFCDQTNLSVLAATRGLGVPVVISERSDPSQQRLSRGWERARKLLYPRATSTIALTPTAANYLQPLCRHDVIVIPSAVQRPPITSDRTAAQLAQHVLAIGRLEPEKGFDRLLPAFAQATGTSPTWTLTILGEGSQRERLERLIDQHGLSERVRLPGWVRPVWDELAKATFFVLPSYYEGFPSALLEAMAMGVPSLAVDCESGPREIITSGVNGILVANNATALSVGIQDMITQPQTREPLGTQGKSVVEQFSWEAMVDRYEQVLIKATNPTAPSSTASSEAPH